MDNRFIFLYFISSELWGHRTGGRAGNENTGASVGSVWQANPSYKERAGCGAKISSEAAVGAVKKSRYCVI